MRSGARAVAIIGPALFLTVVLAGLLLATEWAVRLLAPEPPPLRFVELGEDLANSERAEFAQLIEPDPDTFWRMAPNLVGPADGKLFIGRLSNGKGFREDHEIPLARGDRELRILFLGASGAFGLRLPLQDTYVEKIETQLAERFPDLRVECINAAVPGYGLFQGWQLLRRDGLAYQPDLVVADFGWNDQVEQYEIGDIELHQRQQAARPPILASSRLATLVWRLFRPLDLAGGGGDKRARLGPDEYGRVLGWLRDASLAKDADFMPLISGAGVNILPGKSRELRTAHQLAQYAFAGSLLLRDGVTRGYFDGVAPLHQLAKVHHPIQLFFDGYHPRPIVNQRTAAEFVEQIGPWVEWRIANRDE